MEKLQTAEPGGAASDMLLSKFIANCPKGKARVIV
jgi:hypothetical protein